MIRPRLVPLALSLLWTGTTPTEGTSQTWTGAVNSLWSEPGNWTPYSPFEHGTPSLVFPRSATRFTSINDLPGSTRVESITILADYSIEASPGSSVSRVCCVTLSGGNAKIAMPFENPLGEWTEVWVVDSGARLELAGPIGGPATAVLRGYGRGTLVLSGDNSFSGATGVGDPGGNPRDERGGGSVFVNGPHPLSRTNVSHARLGGTGTVGTLTLSGGQRAGLPAILQPGGETETGVLTVAGETRLDGGLWGNIVRFRLRGTVPGSEYDQLQVNANVVLPEPTESPLTQRPILDLEVGFEPPVGHTFTLIRSLGLLSGQFDVGPDGSVFRAGCFDFRINYNPDAVSVTRVLGGSLPAQFHTLPPCRLIDTRSPFDFSGGPGQTPLGSPALAADGSRAFHLPGSCGIPSTARAISANITVPLPASAGNLRIYATGQPEPLASVVNFGPGQTRASNGVVGFPCGGPKSLTVRNNSPAVSHVILDVNGYFE